MSIGAISGFGGGCNFPSISEMRQNMFNKMDQDGDGLISKTEFQTAAEKRAQKTGQTMDVDEVFAAIDTNQDGSIDKSENDAAMESMKPPPPPPDMMSDLSGLLEKIFAAMDTNQDGAVDKTEYEAAMNQIEGQLEGSTASAASSSGTTDSSATTASSTDASADTSTESSLLALIQQLLESMLSYEKYQHDYASSGSQDSKSVNSYA